MANSGGMLRLSGGTLFTLMVRAMKRHGRNRGNYGKKGGGITQANMLKDLLKGLSRILAKGEAGLRV